MNGKINFTNNSDIRLGFEIECVIFNTRKNNLRPFYQNDTIQWKRFRQEIFALKRNVQIGYDGSITFKGLHTGTELRTPPLPPKDAMKLLIDVFAIVNRCGYTNSSCGLHVNVSSTDKRKMSKFNPLPFMTSNLWDELLEEFNRRSNKFCLPVMTDKRKSKSTINVIKHLIARTDVKYQCVHLGHFRDGQGKHSRIEIRGFGNHDYSKKYDVIASYIKRIEKLFNLSCGRFSELKAPVV